MGVFPITASADMGPKPSVVIDFEGLSGESYYVTLLSSTPSTGPYSALSFLKQDNPSIDEKEWYYGDEKDYPIYLRFLEYQDTDGYYFLQYFQNCSETHQFSWTYYPPPDFKILLYFPEKDSFVVGGPVERYAFSSYFSATVLQEVRSNTEYYDNMDISRSYDYSGEMLSLAARIVLTIAVEMLIALLFVFRKKKQLVFILMVNLVTQIALNIALNIINFNYGSMAFVFAFVLLELAVFIIEAILYTGFLGKLGETILPKWKPITYALVANVVSFAVGLGLANIIPGIF
jgi:hypothetical protein